MDKIDEVLTRRVEKIYPSKETLEKVLKSGKKIRIYLGFDPSNPKLHLGHTLVLKKIKEFQNLGHEIILLIGDFTGKIGDPTDKLSTRKKLTKEKVLKNAKTYKEQAGKILNFSGKNPVKIKFNSEWLDKLKFSDIAGLAYYFTVQQFIERDMYQKRLKEGKPISLAEFLYPLMQAYDGVAMEVDMEVGGNDQTFNMLAGRSLMKSKLGKEKFVLTVPLLVGTDGQKMGKSLGNYISLTEGANYMYGKVMSISDNLIIEYFELCTDVPLKTIKEYKKELKKNPMTLKKKLAFEITKTYYGEKEVKAAEKEFKNVFQQKKAPTKTKTIECEKKEYKLIDILVKNYLVSSKGDAKRIIKQGGIDLDGKPITDIQFSFKPKEGNIIKIGKTKFIKISLKK